VRADSAYYGHDIIAAPRTEFVEPLRSRVAAITGTDSDVDSVASSALTRVPQLMG